MNAARGHVVVKEVTTLKPVKIIDFRKQVLEKALREKLLLKGKDFPVVSL